MPRPTPITPFPQANVVWAFLAVFAALYAYLWDITRDWGLSLFSSPSFSAIFSRRDCDLPHHRDDRGNSLLPMLYPARNYRIAAGTNFLARCSWAYNLSLCSPIDGPVADFLVAGLEIARRCQWTLLRVEYEHLTNASKFRSLCYVPAMRGPRASVVGRPGQESSTGGRAGGGTARDSIGGLCGPRDSVSFPRDSLMEPMMEGGRAGGLGDCERCEASGENILPPSRRRSNEFESGPSCLDDVHVLGRSCSAACSPSALVSKTCVVSKTCDHSVLTNPTDVGSALESSLVQSDCSTCCVAGDDL